jgi:hypothetical protein
MIYDFLRCKAMPQLNNFTAFFDDYTSLKIGFQTPTIIITEGFKGNWGQFVPSIHYKV